MALTHPRTSDEAVLDEQESERRRLQRQQNQAAIDLLNQLISIDDIEAAEQRETLNYLERILNEDRLSDRDRFPSQG